MPEKVTFELSKKTPAPFMDDPEAVAIRESIDFSKRISIEEAMNDTGKRFI